MLICLALLSLILLALLSLNVTIDTAILDQRFINCLSFVFALFFFLETERARYDAGPDPMFGGEYEGGFTADDFFQFFTEASSRHGFPHHDAEPDFGFGSGHRHYSQHVPPPQKGKAGGRTEDGNVDFPISLEELYKGKVAKFTSTRNKLCDTCKGTTGKPKTKPKTCAKCEGVGHVEKSYSISPGIVSSKYVECNSCNGRGELFREKDRCKKCNESGLVEETKILEAFIPKGAPDGYKIVLQGEADEEYGKKTGDVVIQIKVKEHQVFKRENHDLHATIKISLAEAICGFSKVVLKHLDGRGIRVTTKPGSVLQPDQVIKVAGEGMPIPKTDRRGDLYLKAGIEFPPNGWCVETADLRTLKDMLPEAPVTVKQKGLKDISESEIDDVEFRVIEENQLPEYPKDTNGPKSNDSKPNANRARSATESCATQ